MVDIVELVTRMQVPQLVHDDCIKRGKPVMGNQRPVYSCGGFAVAMQYDVNGEKWAYRCWFNKIDDVEDRLVKLSAEIKKIKLPYFCDFTFTRAGILYGNEYLPSTRMRWIDGDNIKAYICNHKSEPKVLKQLAADFKKMCQQLHKRHIAHGDLQHGNILVDNEGKIYLIDYDSMYFPALDGVRDNIDGSAGYQHPKRNSNKTANHKLDYFSELVIYISILAIALNPNLVKKYKVDDADRLLFTKNDFNDLGHSEIWQDIKKLSSPILSQLLDILCGYLEHNSINEIGPFDFMLSLADRHIRYNERQYCPQCGVAYNANEDDRFCIKCGKPLWNAEL